MAIATEAFHHATRLPQRARARVEPLRFQRILSLLLGSAAGAALFSLIQALPGEAAATLLACLAGTGAWLYAGTAAVGVRAAAISLPALPLIFALALAAPVAGPGLATAYGLHALTSLLLATTGRLEPALQQPIAAWGAAHAVLAWLLI